MKLPIRLLCATAALVFSGSLAAAATLVSDASLNLRSGPGVQYPVVGVIADGGAVDVLNCGAGWCRVDYRGVVGWASRAYLTGAVGSRYAAEPYVYNTEPYYATNVLPYYDNYNYFGYIPSNSGYYFTRHANSGHYFTRHAQFTRHATPQHNAMARRFSAGQTRTAVFHAAPHPMQAARPAAAHFASAPHGSGAPHIAASAGAHFGTRPHA